MVTSRVALPFKWLSALEFEQEETEGTESRSSRQCFRVFRGHQIWLRPNAALGSSERQNLVSTDMFRIPCRDHHGRRDTQSLWRRDAILGGLRSCPIKIAEDRCEFARGMACVCCWCCQSWLDGGLYGQTGRHGLSRRQFLPGTRRGRKEL